MLLKGRDYGGGCWHFWDDELSSGWWNFSVWGVCALWACSSTFVSQKEETQNCHRNWNRILDVQNSDLFSDEPFEKRPEDSDFHFDDYFNFQKRLFRPENGFLVVYHTFQMGFDSFVGHQPKRILFTYFWRSSCLGDWEAHPWLIDIAQGRSAPVVHPVARASCWFLGRIPLSDFRCGTIETPNLAERSIWYYRPSSES